MSEMCIFLTLASNMGHASEAGYNIQGTNLHIESCRSIQFSLRRTGMTERGESNTRGQRDQQEGEEE